MTSLINSCKPFLKDLISILHKLFQKIDYTSQLILCGHYYYDMKIRQTYYKKSTSIILWQWDHKQRRVQGYCSRKRRSVGWLWSAVEARSVIQLHGLRLWEWVAASFWKGFKMTKEKPLPKKFPSSKTDFKAIARDEFFKDGNNVTHISNSNEVTGLKESEEKLKQQDSAQRGKHPCNATNNQGARDERVCHSN